MPTGGVDQLATAQVDQSQTGANTSGFLIGIEDDGCASLWESAFLALFHTMHRLGADQP